MKRSKHYDSIILNLRRLRNIELHFLEQYFDNKEIPYQHLMMINALCKKGPIPINRIKETYNFSAPAATQLITSLEKKGYITRVKSSEDKRISLITLSELGKKTLQNGLKFYEEGMNPLIEYLGEEDSNNFNRILERFIEYFDTKQGNYEKK